MSSPPKNLRRSTRIKAHVTYIEDCDEETDEERRQNRINQEDSDSEATELSSESNLPRLTGLRHHKAKSKKTSDAEISNKIPESLKTLPTLQVVLENILQKVTCEPLNADNKDINMKASYKRDSSSDDKNLSDKNISVASVYEPTDSEDESSKCTESESETSYRDSDASEDSDKEKKKVKKHKQYEVQKSVPEREIPNTLKTGRKHTTVVHKDYHIKTDEYFESQSQKTITSDRTLGRLPNAHLTEETLEELLENKCHISTTHKKNICALTENHKSFFSMWQFILEEGYSLILHGLGSKKNLLDDFHNEIIAEAGHPALVINGFFPSLSMKDILDNILVELLNLNSSTNSYNAVVLIEKALKDNPKDRLYLVIHNIDGIMLRSRKAQDTLCDLAAIPNIRIIASVDHINAPILWNSKKHMNFNFYWWDATTFSPYQAETAYESSLMVQQSGVLALSSLQNVFFSLTTNAQAVYLILVKYQLSHGNTNLGMTFEHLYRAAREQFLVSSDLALYDLLHEFICHKLIRPKRTVKDNVKHLNIPFDKAILKQFMEQLES